jgi:hypothetical protein
MGIGVLLGLVALGGWLELAAVDGTGADCLDARRLEGRVAEQLGQAPFDARAGIRARASIDRTRRGLVARLDLFTERGDRSGTREIVARSARCTDLETALTLTLVLALGQSLPPPAPEVMAAAGPPAGPPPTAIAVSLPSPAARSAPSWRTWLGAGGVAGGLPGLAFGPSLGARAETARLSLGSEGRFEWAIPVQHAGVQVQSWRATGAVVPCVRAGTGAFCGVVRAGLLRASSSQSSGSPVLELASRLIVGFLGGRAAVYVEPGFALVRTRLLIDGRPAWTTPRFSAGAGLMISTR